MLSIFNLKLNFDQFIKRSSSSQRSKIEIEIDVDALVSLKQAIWRRRRSKMDPEQTFIRVQERFSQILNPRIRALLEYTFLFVAITLFSILVVMHANYVQQVLYSLSLSFCFYFSFVKDLNFNKSEIRVCIIFFSRLIRLLC